MKQENIISNLSTITKIPVKLWNEIIKKECLCIGSAISDSISAGEDIAVLNIGIGTLSVELKTKECKFIPSKELKNTIKKSIDSNIDPLEFELEQEIIEKLLKICDEVL